MNDAEKEALIAEIFQRFTNQSLARRLAELFEDREKYGEAFTPLDGPPIKRQGYLDEV